MFNYFDIDQHIVLEIKRFEKDELADLGIHFNCRLSRFKITSCFMLRLCQSFYIALL